MSEKRQKGNVGSEEVATAKPTINKNPQGEKKQIRRQK